MVEENEFDKLEVEEENAPANEFSDVPDSNQDDMIASGSAGTKYDWTKAPEGTKAPPRIDLDGKEVVVKKADIILPPADKPWSKTRDGEKEYKYCTFVLHYDVDGQQEFYSGVRVFKRDNGKYSHPTITRDRNNQASKLYGIYADLKKKDINEVNLKEFMAFLNGQPKAKIKTEDVVNPSTNQSIKKNFVEKFISD